MTLLTWILLLTAGDSAWTTDVWMLSPPRTPTRYSASMTPWTTSRVPAGSAPWTCSRHSVGCEAGGRTATGVVRGVGNGSWRECLPSWCTIYGRPPDGVNNLLQLLIMCSSPGPLGVHRAAGTAPYGKDPSPFPTDSSTGRGAVRTSSYVCTAATSVRPRRDPSQLSHAPLQQYLVGGLSVLGWPSSAPSPSLTLATATSSSPWIMGPRLMQGRIRAWLQRCRGWRRRCSPCWAPQRGVTLSPRCSVRCAGGWGWARPGRRRCNHRATGWSSSPAHTSRTGTATCLWSCGPTGLPYRSPAGVRLLMFRWEPRKRECFTETDSLPIGLPATPAAGDQGEHSALRPDRRRHHLLTTPYS